MEYRFARRALRAWWQEGVADFEEPFQLYHLRFIVADFDLKRSTLLSDLTFAPFPNEKIFKRNARQLVSSPPEPNEFTWRAPDDAEFFASIFTAETTVYGFAWVRTPQPPNGADPLLIVVKYSAPVVVKAGDEHGVAHTIRFGPALVLPE